jgi:sugar fermentation stimulation protein A
MIRSEVTFGRSRFDFAVDTPGGTVLVEVKSCTLCEHAVAMFPDAPTSRGKRHLEEMAALVESGEVAGGIVLFVVGNRSPELFIPNIHTDPQFSGALAAVSELLTVRACSISVSQGGTVVVTNLDVPVSYRPVELALEDRGVYLVVLSLERDTRIETGGLGEVFYKSGWYVYVGSAKRALASRVRRHLAKRKTRHWHIDYLSIAANSARAYPIYTDLDLECELAEEVRRAGGAGVKGFGSSDCTCESHLFRFGTDPFKSRAFVDILFTYRHRRALENYLPASIARRES